MSTQIHRIIIIDPSTSSRTVLARRLRAQGYFVEDVADATTGANMALASPPSAVVADLWMPGISGIQLCRLLRSEAATAHVPVVLCGNSDEPRDRFWADRAGANAYVSKQRMGELVRALAQSAASVGDDSFFIQLSGGVDIRERIAQQLDTALFDAVIASEVRALAACGEFDRLFDLFAQFFSQVSRYHWLALGSVNRDRLAVHHRPGMSEMVDQELLNLVGGGRLPVTMRIEDEDAYDRVSAAPTIVREIPFAGTTLGFIAVAPCSLSDSPAVASLTSLIAREVGGPLRMTTLVEESQRLASTDALTGLMNRRAFSTAVERELIRSVRYGHPLSLIMLDVDHFKKVNDEHGHAMGDLVLQAIGGVLSRGPIRQTDLAARWGGEEFVVAYLSTPGEGAVAAAERLRAAIEELVILDEHGKRIAVTASIGLTVAYPGDTLAGLVERADSAMYASKAAGRNRLTCCDETRLRAEPRRSMRPSGRPSGRPSARPSGATREPHPFYRDKGASSSPTLPVMAACKVDVIRPTAERTSQRPESN